MLMRTLQILMEINLMLFLMTSFGAYVLKIDEFKGATIILLIEMIILGGCLYYGGA